MYVFPDPDLVGYSFLCLNGPLKRVEHDESNLVSMPQSSLFFFWAQCNKYYIVITVWVVWPNIHVIHTNQCVCLENLISLCENSADFFLRNNKTVKTIGKHVLANLALIQHFSLPFKTTTDILLPGDPMPILEHRECTVEPGCTYDVYVETADRRIQTTQRYTVPGLSNSRYAIDLLCPAYQHRLSLTHTMHAYL